MERLEYGMLPIRYDVYTFTHVSQSVRQAVLHGISLVWGRHIDAPMQTEVIFLERIVTDQGEDTGFNACYNPIDNAFKFAVKRIKEKFDLPIPEEAHFLLLAAHEAKHRVQIHLGAKIRPTPYIIDQDYKDDPYEDEAWREAVDVFKHVYPDSSGSILVNGKEYNIPERSSYDTNSDN